MVESRDSTGRRRLILNPLSPHDRAIAYAMAELVKNMTEDGRVWLASNGQSPRLDDHKPALNGHDTTE
jgi:hypothetical protein